MSCWPACIEEMKLLLFVCTLVFVLCCERNPVTLRTTSDLMMNVNTCVTDNTTYAMLYIRSVCQI